jgi:hypothetical protein
MPGEVPYTSQLPYLVHPAMRTHPSFVPPTDGSMIQGASPLYANFVPPTQVGGYAGTNQGYCGNTYLPDQQAPINSSSGNSGYVQSTMHDGSVDPLGGSMSMVGMGLGMGASQLNTFQKMRIAQANAMANKSILSLAPNDQNFVQASGQQNLMFGPGNPFLLRPSAMNPQNNWLHAQTPDRTPHMSVPVGMAPGTMSHAQPTTFVSLYQVPSGGCNTLASLCEFSKTKTPSYFHYVLIPIMCSCRRSSDVFCSHCRKRSLRSVRAGWILWNGAK